jgi:hypothetical protein
VEISINDKVFDTSSSLKWSGSYLVFFPDERLPVGATMSVNVRVADLQKY